MVELLKLNYEVLVIDNFVNSNEAVISRVESIASKKVNFVKCDLNKIDELFHVFNNFKPDAVMHFAGLKSVFESVRDPLRYYQNNVVGSLNLLKAMDETNCKKIIFSSSATVYGEANYLPYDEKHNTKPVNPYGHSKLITEMILDDWVNTDNNKTAIALRYFNPVGAHKSGLIGEDPTGIPNNLMPYICQVAIGKIECLRIFGDDFETRDGSGERDFIHVVDLAIAHISALENIHSILGYDAINIGTGSGYTVFELIETFQQISNIKIPTMIVERRDGDIARSWANPDKALSKLNWKAKRTLKEMCEDAWHWQKQNPHGY